MRIRRAGLIAAAALLAGCAVTPHPAVLSAAWRAQVDAALATEPGVRFGLSVTDLEGHDLIARDADERFLPASTVKLFTTAAAYATLPDLDRPEPAGGTGVRLEAGDVVLVGAGDPALSDRPGCASDCLATLADAVARSGVREVRDVIGDDRLYADERWGPGWAVDDMATRSGTAVSALTLDDNVAALDVAPGPTAGAPAQVTWRDGEAYLLVRNAVVTVSGGAPDIHVERSPASRIVRLTGTIPLGAAPERESVGLDDPAEHAAFHLRRLIEARGVRVTGRVTARHRAPGDAPTAAEAPPLARLPLGAVADDIALLLKTSQNLHAELLLRRIGDGSSARGIAAVEAMLARIGVPRVAYDLADGSGLSSYDRVTPRAVTTLLRWAATQPWGPAWRAALPVGGTDGTLAHRFRDTPLAGRIFAKTGTLSGTNAVSGYLIAASGRMLVFSLLANDRPWTAGSALPAMDAALLAIAAAH